MAQSPWMAVYTLRYEGTTVTRFPSKGEAAKFAKELCKEDGMEIPTEVFIVKVPEKGHFFIGG